MDEQMNAADKGPEGEKRFREWLAQNKLGFVPICQQKETFATLFFGAVKRPDFLVLIDSIGIIASIRNIRSRRKTVSLCPSPRESAKPSPSRACFVSLFSTLTFSMTMKAMMLGIGFRL